VITLTWADSEKNLLIWEFGQRWSATDFMTACQTSKQMKSSVTHSVDVVMDLSKSQFYPMNLMSLMRTAMRTRCHNTGKVMLVSESNLWSRLYQHVKKIYPKDVVQVEFVSSLTMAMKNLRSYLVEEQVTV
jgi:hypothetical protein